MVPSFQRESAARAFASSRHRRPCCSGRFPLPAAVPGWSLHVQSREDVETGRFSAQLVGQPMFLVMEVTRRGRVKGGTAVTSP